MIVGLFAVAIGLFACSVGAVFLQAAIALANKVFKPDAAGFRRSVTSRPERGDQSQTKFNSLADPKPDEPPVGSNPFAGSNKPVSKDTSSDTNPYATPINHGRPQTKIRSVLKPAIPAPTYGHAFGICFLQGIIVACFSAVIATAVAAIGQVSFGVLFPLGLSFVVATIVYSLMIPTSFGKAAVVYLFQVLIAIAVALMLSLTIAGALAIAS